MIAKRAIVWFRQDLRLHDNEALTDALRSAEEVLPVYVFDPRIFNGKTRFGFPKTGKFRTQFILESVLNLKRSLQQLGSDLIIRVGLPEEEIYDLARQAKTNWIFCNRERTQEEVDVQDALEKKLWSIGQEIRFSRGKMLYYTADLPFPVTHTPDIFTHFRKEVERFTPIREPLPAPKERFTPWSLKIEIGELPQLSDFDLENFKPDPRSAFNFKGGEQEALKRLHYYFWELESIKNYKETRNGMIGGAYSSKFAPWLSQGCLSPKLVYHELKKFEEKRGANESTYWLFLELLWRDFFRLMGKKHGNKIFLKGGINGRVDSNWEDNFDLLKIWTEGRTGIPFIDANMRELNHTGFMSNRGRQNVASFLVKDLQVNWQMGAEYFESLLLDYDPCSNWGNWNYIAGVGSDPRENRSFNILSQAKRYDCKGDYVKLWLPELTKLPNDKIHQPDLLSREDQKMLQLQIGIDYPKAMISTSKWG